MRNRGNLLLLAVLAACGGSAMQQIGDAGTTIPATDPTGTAPPAPTFDAGTGVDAGSPSDAGAPAQADAGSPPAACLATPLLKDLGWTRVMVGADMTTSIAEQAPFDIRYLYLSGGLADGSGTCSSCSSGCTAAGASCGSTTSACGWWGCWQDVAVAPGQYVRDLLAATRATGQLPMITYYEILQTSKVVEGAPEVTSAILDPALMTRFWNDFRFLLQQVGASPALLHVEPDFWGYAEKVNQDPHQLPAEVAAVNAADCASQENSVAGMGRCIVAMVRKYAPKAKVGLHASGWATGFDAISNRDPTLDVAALGRKLADFLLAAGGADLDFIGVDIADRDAGYMRTLGVDSFWDPTNATLPNFTQAFTWAHALTTRLGKPALFWQIPVGNMSLPNVNQAWQDVKLDYFFAHPSEVAAANAFGMVFGAGEIHQTTPSTDHGNLVARVKSLFAAGGQNACVP